MLRTTFRLIAKKQLTHDVYELIYTCQDLPKEPPKPGQYVMFQLAPGLNRAYSLSSIGNDGTSFTLIIKRIPDGRGSPMICDAEVGSELSGMIPLGHFTLRETPAPKCFIGTGTGFAPLYCQMYASQLLSTPPEKCHFIFGVRHRDDSFYEDEIQDLGRGFQDFTFLQYFSRETFASDTGTKRSGYVIDWITPAHIDTVTEYYLCGSPAMVKSAREKLEALGVQKDMIFWEQF